jgi:hypothetical protein
MSEHSDLNLPGEFDIVADVEVNAEVQQLPHTLIKPASQCTSAH